jgi:ABC-2 type transport system ATP-binding protein
MSDTTAPPPPPTGEPVLPPAGPPIATVPPPELAPTLLETEGDVAVRIRGMVKRYGQLRAVDALDLDVPLGGIHGMVGPNGAGKTTTMLAIATLLEPDEGELSVLGDDPRHDPRAVRRKVGFVPDVFGLYDGLSCAEYLDFFASAYDVPRDVRPELVSALLELVELQHKADTDVAGLSRGMQQRLSLARGLVHDPQLLVADEPASGLDPRARVELREILLELARRGVTVIISSHILAELDELCDHVSIIEAGKVLAQGTPDQIRGSIGSVYTVSLRVLGGPEALLAAATLVGDAGVHRIDGDRLVCELLGGADAAAALLAQLVAAGVRVLEFREERVGLERLFLSVTDGVIR